MKSGNSEGYGSAFGFEATPWATDGEFQFTLPGVLKLPLIPQHLNLAESTSRIASAGQLRIVVNQLQPLLHSTVPAAEPTRIVVEAERQLNVVEEWEAMVSVNPDKPRASVRQRATRLQPSILQKARTGKL